MAKKRNGNKKRGMTIPIAVVAGFAPLVGNVLSTPGGIEPKGWMLTQAMTGFDTRTREFWLPNLWKGAFPILIGIFAHKVASRLGVNRALAGAGIPILRV